MTLNALLEELGCNKSEIDEFILMGEENRYDAQQRLLRKKRQQLPDAIHTSSRCKITAPPLFWNIVCKIDNIVVEIFIRQMI